MSMAHLRYGNSMRQTERPLWQRAILTNFPVLLFIALAGAGMFIVYLRFNPTPADAGMVVAAIEQADGLSALIHKPVAARPVKQRLAQSPGPIRIGIIAGHKGSDSGAVCDDGLTELEITERIATLVVNHLNQQGIRAMLLEEFDAQLQGFSGTALISIHADSCQYYNELATGYKLSGSSRTDSSQLSICMELGYSEATHLPYHANTITPHMTDYHAFRLIAPGTPAIILETGFMNLDRELLTTRHEVAVGGIVNGIACFLESLES